MFPWVAWGLADTILEQHFALASAMCQSELRFCWSCGSAPGSFQVKPKLVVLHLLKQICIIFISWFQTESITTRNMFLFAGSLRKWKWFGFGFELAADGKWGLPPLFHHQTSEQPDHPFAAKLIFLTGRRTGAVANYLASDMLCVMPRRLAYCGWTKSILRHLRSPGMV